ncbi:hypothetical protein HMPREF3208_01440 [Gardnerella vaginalis]|uniref:Uncharacterized protein n=1 Tax=Gardnerella vaginalis TaxID=2702 RepID=A0A133NNK7_GARVA|nr:hypothetical protein HMPREF3208_01440 [Gardnerella vaginalis]
MVRFEIFRTERRTLARLTRSLRNSRWKSTGFPTLASFRSELLSRATL